MSWKRFFSIILCSFLLLSFAACGKDKNPDKSPESESNKGSYSDIVSDSSDGEESGSLSEKTEEELISLFLSTYDTALSSPAYFKEYNFSVLYNGETLSNSIGYFMVNGKDFSVDWIDYVKDENSATFVYKDGVLYATKNGEEIQKTVAADEVKTELETAGAVFEEVPLSDFATKTFVRNDDGSFVLDVVLTDGALQKISAKTLTGMAKIPGKSAFKSVSFSLAFSENGALLRSRLLAFVDVTLEDGTVLPYSTEAYLKYTSFDPSKIVITAPEDSSDDATSDSVGDGNSTANSDSTQTTDSTDSD